jgi:hypothetical protein
MANRISKILLALTVAVALRAQPPAGGRGGPPPTAKAAAPIDLTGYWVSVVTEDWRYRMVTPAPGDYQGVPMTAAARKIADAWDPEKEAASGDICKSFGAPAILRVPERLHITWTDDQTLQLETDAGKQTRVFHFAPWKEAEGPHTLQGESMAEWQIQRSAGRPAGGSLKVSTSHLKAGFLRKNGVPYSENTGLVEYYDLVRERNGDILLVVTIVITDPLYLREPMIISSHFKKQPDGAGWNPVACSANW